MTESLAPLADSLTGLTLETARALLTAKGISEAQITVIETVPPRAERATGAWRVLRCRLDSQQGDAHFELTAAREQCVESRTGSQTSGHAPSSSVRPPGG